MRTALLVGFAYLCGSVPWGVVWGRTAGVDIRRAGSGNIGATNVARIAGARPALLTLLADVAKGLVPTLLARFLLSDAWLVAAVGLTAFFGHIFSVFLRFSGGKGVATGSGVFLSLAPAPLAVCAAIFVAVGWSTGYVSLASVTASGALPVAVALLGYRGPTLAAAVVISAVIIIRHRDNLVRLYNGTEPKFRVRQ